MIETYSFKGWNMAPQNFASAVRGLDTKTFENNINRIMFNLLICNLKNSLVYNQVSWGFKFLLLKKIETFDQQMALCYSGPWTILTRDAEVYRCLDYTDNS